MIAAILNSAIVDSATVILNSDTLLSSLRFTQKHSHATLTLTQTNSIWLKLIHSHLTWWCQPSWILPSWTKKKLHSSFWIQPSWILPSWIQPFWTEKKLHSFILTQLDDGSHLQFYHLGFSHFAQKNFTHSFWLNLMMAAILNSAMLDSDTAILDSDTLLSSLRFTQKHSHSTLTLTQTNSIWLKLIDSHLTWWWQPSWICHFEQNSAHLEFNLTQTHLFSLNLMMSAILPILPSWFQPFWTKKFWYFLSNFTHSFSLNFMMAAILNTAMLDSALPLAFRQLWSSSELIHSHSTLIMTQNLQSD